MSTGYSDTIRRWAADDRRTGTLPNADGTGEVGLGEGEAGRRLAVRFTLRLRGDQAEAVRYQVFGCGFTIAACAAAAELAEGHSLTEIAAIVPTWIDATLGGLPAERDYCATLAVEALQAAVKSAANGHQPVRADIAPEDDHVPLVTANDPTYRLLTDSPAPTGTPPEDRHLFACLLAVTTGQFGDDAALGLSRKQLAELFQRYFPAIRIDDLGALPGESAPCELLQLLLGYLPEAVDDTPPAPSVWLAHALAARASRNGHLWRAMGLSSRAELTAAIRRHLPALAAANNKGMRWKRFFFKQLCELGGGTLCQAPECGACSDYPQCFAPE